MEHSSEFFSPDYVHITLVLMCGVHNYTKDLTVQNIHSFIMIGESESKENVTVNMLSQTTNQFGIQLNKPYCTTLHFFNVSFVNITTLTMKCPSINLKYGIITVKNANLYGFKSTYGKLSSITVTSNVSRALLDNCTFKGNCFVLSNYSAGITVNNSTFQSYRHESKSMIAAYSSAITLTGYVNFTDSAIGLNRKHSSGTALFLMTTHPDLKSSLSIKKGATVHFVNLTSNNDGGAIFTNNGVINIDTKAAVVFMQNKATMRGGAVSVVGNKSLMNFGIESNVVFANNSALQQGGGAILILGGTFNIYTNASVSFTQNNAYSFKGGAIYILVGAWNISTNVSIDFSNNFALYGGATYIERMTLLVGTNALLFYNNTSMRGGAIYLNYGSVHIKCNSTVNFSMNFAQLQGGAMYVTEVNDHAITVDNSSNLLFYNNFAFQGGALYVIPSSFTIHVKPKSRVEFVNNTATDVGGAVYSEIQSASPCMFLVTNSSSAISFIGNNAKIGIGHHMYGTSARYSKCDAQHLVKRPLEYGIPYCLHKGDTLKHINISFQPNLNETLSPVSSVPWRVCLCDSNGKPECTNLSQIFASVKVYRGEEFRLFAYVVGFDFGTTVGSVYAQFLDSRQHCAKLKQYQYEQVVNTSKECSTLSYTVSTKSNDELVRLDTSLTPVYQVFGDKEFIKYISQYTNVLKSCLSDYTYGMPFGCLREELLTTPIFINITLLPGCPPGLTLREDPTNCSCYSVLSSIGFKCSIQNKTGYLQWNSTVWVNATFNDSQSNGILYNRICPLHYCKLNEKTVNIRDYPNEQCASNRTGILCGACKNNFSLAIGSSQCIICHSSHDVALLLAFGAAGVFLVFFILALNLTVTQGLINGLIFYANIVWVYKAILFSSEIQGDNVLIFLQVFIAWLNLDFGIETCFIVGLDAYWKTWLQFLFPLYIWAIAGIQPLRRISHLKLLKWINKLAPVYDAYLAPLNNKHQYWFGAMLLIRGILLIILIVTSTINPEVNVFILSVTVGSLFFFTSVKNVYKRMNVRIVESATFMNLTVLSAGIMYKWESTESKLILLKVSIVLAFTQFCAIVVWNLIKPCLRVNWKCRWEQTYDVISENVEDRFIHERIEDPELETMIAPAKNTATNATY